MPLAVKINVALREQNCQKVGSERVKQYLYFRFPYFANWTCFKNFYGSTSFDIENILNHQYFNFKIIPIWEFTQES